MFTVRFWNSSGECIQICGKYHLTFDTYEDAWDAANALVKEAHKQGAVEMDINNSFYPIIKD